MVRPRNVGSTSHPPGAPVPPEKRQRTENQQSREELSISGGGGAEFVARGGLRRHDQQERRPRFAAIIVNFAADFGMLANARLAKHARIGQTVKQPKGAVADSVKGDAIR